MSRFRFIYQYLYHHKYSYLFGIFLIIMTNWISVTIPLYLQKSVDLLSEGVETLEGKLDLLYEYLGVMLALALGIIVVRTLSRIFFFNPGRAIEYEVKNDLYQKLTKLQKEYYDSNPVGSIISRIQNDITGVRLICGFGMMQFFNILTALSFTPYMMWQLSPSLTLYCVFPIILVFIGVRVAMHFIIKSSRKRMSTLQDLSSFIVTTLSGIDVIKNFELGHWSAKKFDILNQNLLIHSLRIAFLRSFIMPVLQNLENLLKVLILFVGGVFVIKHDFTIGELTAFIAYAGLLTLPITGLGWLTTIIQQGIVGLESLETILNKSTTEADRPRLPNESFEEIRHLGLRVEGLNFTYPGGETVLKNIEFEIKPGQTVGILGKIGSGKTTLVNSINRHLPIDQNRVFWGGKDISQMALQDVRKLIRTVSQDNFLFSDSVRNNICFGSEDSTKIDDGYLNKIVRDSALEEEVGRFPQGLETLVGEKGIMLSGGQKQRISLARALVDPCELLILDNVLSAVDYETERYLLNTIHNNPNAKSLLIVSHRVQALEKADYVLVLEEGRVVEKGTHLELIHRPGLYKETWSLQNESRTDHELA